MTNLSKEIMYKKIKQHGERINELFGTSYDPIAICKTLRRLEIKAEQLALDYCNGTGGINTDNWESKTEPILKKLHTLLNPDNADVRVFVNGDARGYALKFEFDPTDVRAHDFYRDWGGYGIIAPDFNEGH
jgi:hypothetical protein